MFDLSPVILGIVLLGLGLAFIAAALIALRIAPRLQNTQKSPLPPLNSNPITPHTEAVLLVEAGGRVGYINQAGRELFNVWDTEPNLERLAQRTRPSEDFLMLCASEGQARFTLNGRFVDGTSYFAPATQTNGNRGPISVEHRSGILVTLRRPQIVLEGRALLSTDQASLEGQVLEPKGSKDFSPRALQIVTELSQNMAANLELEATLITILRSMERLLPSDYMEITIWQPEAQNLIPYRLIGLPGIDRRLEKASDRYQADSGYSGYLISHHEPLLVKDVNTFQLARPVVDRTRYPFQSYIGVPLLVAGNLVGTLEFASLVKENYTEADLDALRLLSGQAAIALNNALLYEQEHQRSLELAGLANLAQTVSSLRDPQDLYARLVESIVPLIPVEILGFLIYDENRRILFGQTPFLGILDSVVEWYQTTIEPESRAEEYLRSGLPIVTEDATEDPYMQVLDIHHLAQASGIRQAVLMPLAASGKALGFLLVARKKDKTGFESNDLRLLSIIAGQTAPMIENAILISQARQRTQRAESLRRIADLTNSNATLDEVLKYSILDLSRLLQVDSAAMYLLDENHNELRLHQESVFGIPAQVAALPGRLSVADEFSDSPDTHNTLTFTIKPVLIENLEDEKWDSPFYRLLERELHLRSLMGIPLISRERTIAELFLGSSKPGFFLPGDIQTVATGAEQIASAIERSILAAQTDQSLRQRVEQMTAITRISRELNRTLDLDHLLQRIYAETLKATNADCGVIMLFDGENPSLIQDVSQGLESQAALPRILLAAGDKRAGKPGDDFHPLEKRALSEAATQIITDFEAPPAGGIALEPAHAGVRSAMAVPIAYQGRVIGLIHLHSHNPGRFGEVEQDVAEGLAIQASIALNNALRYKEQIHRSEQLKWRVDTLSSLLDISQVLRTERPLQDILAGIANAIRAGTPFDVVLISLYNPASQHLERVASAGITEDLMAELRQHPQSWASIQPLLNPVFQIGRSYFIPAEKADAVSSMVHTVYPRETRGEDFDVDSSDSLSWRPDDLLFVPLFSAAGEPLGLISVDAPRNDQRPDRPTVESLEIFSSQAGLVIENQLEVRNLKSQVNQLQTEIQFQEESARQSQNRLLSFLEKERENLETIQQIRSRAERIQAGLEIAGLIGTAGSRAEVFSILGQETLTRMQFDLVLIAERTPGGLSIVQSFGEVPAEANPKALLGQKNPCRHCLQSGQNLLVSNLDEDEEWRNSPLLNAIGGQNFICLSIAEAQESFEYGIPLPARAAMLAIRRAPDIQYTDEDEKLLELLSHQTAAALRNLAFLEVTSRRLREVQLLLDFSQQLGSLDPTSILQTLVESASLAVPAAQSAMAAIWDHRQAVLTPQAAVGYPDLEELWAVAYQPGEGLPGQVFEHRRAINLEEVNFAVHYNLSTPNLLHFRNATAGKLPVSSLAVPIMAGVILPEGDDERDLGTSAASLPRPLGVLVLDSSQTTGAFSHDDLALITSLAQQTALTLENARLYQASQQRSNQLQALTSASTEITASLEKETLVTNLLEQLQTLLAFDTGTFWLRFKERGVDRMIIAAAQGFEDSDQRIGLVVDVEDSRLMDEMIQTGQPIWVPDVRQDSRFQSLLLSSEFSASLTDEEIKAASGGLERFSWLGVPLISSGQVSGVIALEKNEADFYTKDDIQLAATFAAQTAAGLENAALYQESVARTRELDQRSQTLNSLNRLSGELSGSLNADLILSYATQEFVQLISCTSASALLFFGSGDTLAFATEITGDGFDQNEGANLEQGFYTLQAEYPSPESGTAHFMPGSILPKTTVFERLKESLGVFHSEDIQFEPELTPLAPFLADHGTRSLLIVPISSGGLEAEEAGPETSGEGQRRFHGLLLAHNRESYHFGPDEIELARTICNQTATALQNARLFEQTRNLSEHLEQRVRQRTSELEREHMRSDTLLRIITELSASLDLTQVLNRTLQVLSEYVDAEQIAVLIDRPGQPELQRLAFIESKPTMSPADIEIARRMEQVLSSWVVRYRQSILVDDITRDDRWTQPVQVRESEGCYHSVLGVPLMSGAEALGCLLLLNHRVGYFSLDQLDLVQAAANQVSISVNNAELYRLIRDQAEDLGTMLRSQQIETSRSKAILEAVADGVLVTDTNRQITLFNESAVKILGVERAQVLGKSMEHFAGMFGRASQKWLEKISVWSRDPATYRPGDTYSEQIVLEDGRVISVHLAPVSLRNDFLGTVSIFQDITHQVEVDRLKSEFVATVSHELRTPMTSIKGYVEILLMGAAGGLSEQQTHFLQIVQANTERLAVLVNDLLDISQIESGRISLSLAPTNLEQLADQAIEDLKRRNRGDERRVSIHKEIPSRLPLVLADGDRIRRVFDNLLDNAYHYNLEGGKITIRIQPKDDEVQVIIQDTGLGISLLDKDQVFERFYRGENPLVLGVAGSGLGLSIVRNLIEMHQGHIWAESSGIPGQGSSFIFTLPISPAEGI